MPKFMSDASVARGAILNEQELWRDMVRWSGGIVHEEDGLLFVAGPSSYLRVMIRIDDGVSGLTAVRRGLSDEVCVVVVIDHRGWACRPGRDGSRVAASGAIGPAVPAAERTHHHEQHAVQAALRSGRRVPAAA